MYKIKLVVGVLILLSIISCNQTSFKQKTEESSNQKLTIEGVWELESADWFYDGDTTIYPNEKLQYLKSIKIISHGHYSVITTDSIRDFLHAAHGKYIASDSIYIEKFKLHKNKKLLQDSAIMNYVLKDNFMIISNKNFIENWKRVK